MTRLLSLVMAFAAALTPSGGAGARPQPPPIGHVFVVVLENKSYSESFGHPSSAPYLARTLPARGELLTNYHGVTHLSLGNYIAMISGQGPNIATRIDCPLFGDVRPRTLGPGGQALGQGCVYPRAVRTVAGQLRAHGLTWRAYMEDMGNGGPGQPKTCRHPAIGSLDTAQRATVGDQYATRHNPFVYFHSIVDDRAGCRARDVSLGRLPADLARRSKTRNYSFIVPNLCNDGHDGGSSGHCVNGRPGGLTSANKWLARWVPKILAAPAFRRDGLLIVTFDEAETGDAGACCGEPRGSTGGGRIGAVLVSPFIRPGSVSAVAYDHYGMLRSVEDVFGLGHLGHAGRPGLRPFGADVYTRPCGTSGSAHRRVCRRRRSATRASSRRR